tara:strand:- start:6 stop:431 length:426 start_codon:yes stop_codon:yes gene_type:complete
MTKSEEYELVPIKPLKDLQAEMKKFRQEIGAKPKNAPKEYTNILNAVSKIENKFELTVKNLKKITDRLDKIIDIFGEDIGEEGEDIDKMGEILKRLETLESVNQDISENLKAVTDELKRRSYLRDRFPGGLPVVYKRSRPV